MIWAPVALLVITSTTVAGLLAQTGVHSLFYGLTAYTVGVAVLTSVAFGCLIRTLFSIKKNLASMNEPEDSWPPVREIEEKPRPSFATEEIDAIRDGASWITSNASSRRGSVSAWSFTTHQTTTTTHHGAGRPQSAMHPSVPAKSSFWFGSTTPNDIEVPPVPPLPSPYGPLSPALAESDPFRRDLPPLPTQQKPRMGSQSSWLTSSQGSHTTISAWSYPTAHEGTIRHESTPDLRTAYSPSPESRPITPALAHAQVLGGYGYGPGALEVEKGLAALAAPVGTTLEITMAPAYGWSVMIWLPLVSVSKYIVRDTADDCFDRVFHYLTLFSFHRTRFPLQSSKFSSSCRSLCLRHCWPLISSLVHLFPFRSVYSMFAIPPCLWTPIVLWFMEASPLTSSLMSINEAPVAV